MDPMQRWTLEASYRAFERGESDHILLRNKTNGHDTDHDLNSRNSSREP